MPSSTPDINCFVGSPYLGADGNWHCQGDTVPPATNAQLRKMNLPPLIKMSMMSPPIKVDPIDPAPTVAQTLDIKNCRRRQAPQNYTYLWNGSGCVLVALADAPAYIRQLQQQGIDNNTGTVGGDVSGTAGANLSGLISQHPILALAAVAGAVYVFAGRGMKPKSREVVSTTRY